MKDLSLNEKNLCVTAPTRLPLSSILSILRFRSFPLIWLVFHNLNRFIHSKKLSTADFLPVLMDRNTIIKISTIYWQYLFVVTPIGYLGFVVKLSPWAVNSCPIAFARVFFYSIWACMCKVKRRRLYLLSKHFLDSVILQVLKLIYRYVSQLNDSFYNGSNSRSLCALSVLLRRWHRLRPLRRFGL